MYDTWLVMAVVFFLLMLSSIVLSWTNFFTLKKLQRTLAELQHQRPPEHTSHVQQPARPQTSQTDTQADLATQLSAKMAASQIASPEPPATATEPDADFDTAAPETRSAESVESETPTTDPWGASPANPKPQTQVKPAEDATPAGQSSLKANWMVWLGGLCVGLSGIFLARYSMEQGLLGPQARILLGILLGLGLLVAAEWLRRKTHTAYTAVAALAGGASIVLYSVILSALHLYHLWPPMLVFALLALVSLGSMLLAVWHGPVLALIGITGAYLVPLMLGGSGSDLLPVLIYVLIITGSSLFLQRYVQRNWLFVLTLAGTLSWWWLVQLSGRSLEWTGLYLTLSAYLFLSIPTLNFRLMQPIADQPRRRSIKAFLRFDSASQQHLFIGLILIILAQTISIALRPDWHSALWYWTPLLLLLLFASRFNESLKLLPWCSALLLFSSLVVAHLHTDWQFGLVFRPLLPQQQLQLLQLLLLWTLAYGAQAFWQLRSHCRYPALVLSLGVLTPLIALALAWQLAGNLLQDWFWSAASLLCGLAYIGRAQQRAKQDHSRSWLIFAGHLGYSLAAVILLEPATLTLALAAQVVSLAWLQQQQPDALLSWVMKALIMLILARLTLQPWVLQQYDTSLLSYGGCLVLVLVASRINHQERLSRWLEGASLHLLVLFLAMLLRYWLHDGALFIHHYSFTEAAFNTLIWGSIGLVYYYRSALAENTHALCLFASRLLLLAAVLNYLVLLTSLNPAFNPRIDLSSTPIFNGLLLAYGAPILIFVLAARWYLQEYRTGFWGLAGIGNWIFITLEVRHLWQGSLSTDLPMQSGELYSYSLVWLLMAASAILIGSLRQWMHLYQAGMLLLLITIAKIFLIDMSDLIGLLRVASFMGLGLCLLGLAFVHQWLSLRRAAVSEPPEASTPANR